MTKRLVAPLIGLGLLIGACGSSGGIPASAAGFCSLAMQAQYRLQDTLQSTVEPGGSAADARTGLQTLIGAAPDEIKPDLEVLADHLATLSENQTPSAVDTVKIGTAAVNVTKYMKDDCRRDMGTPTSRP